MDTERGVYVVSIANPDKGLKGLLRENDVIIKFGGAIINNLGDLLNATHQADLSKPLEMVVFRNQKETLILVPPNTVRNTSDEKEN
jgi:S1-C subfamily serine protease